MSKEKLLTIAVSIAAVGTIAYFTILAPDREVDISTQNQNVNLEEIVAEDEVNKASDYVLVYDPVAKEYKKLKLSVLIFKDDEEEADAEGVEEPEEENIDSPTPTTTPSSIGDVVTPDELADLSTSDLTDVSDNTPTAGQVLVWDVGANQWKPATLNILEGEMLDEQAVHVDEAGEIAALTEKGTPAGTDFILIEDSEDSNTKKKIQISNLPTGSSVSDIDDLGDVDTSTSAPTNGQVLVWDLVNSEWVPGDLPTSGATSANELSDVDTATIPPTAGQVLVWDAGASEWVPGDLPSAGASAIDELTDVDTSTSAPTDGQSLVWNAVNGEWEPQTIVSDTGVDTNAIHDNVSGEISSLAEKATPVAGDLILIEDSENSNTKKYVQVGSLPTGATSADELSDVDTSSVAPTDGQALVWDNAGSKWVPGDLPSGGASAIGDLSDVDTSSVAPTDGQSLVWNNSTGEWEPQTIVSDTGVDTSAIHDNVSGEISVITEKATPVSGDFILIEDSEASNAKKRIQVGNLPMGASAIDELSDVDTSSTAPTAGQALVWDNSGSKWVPGDLPSGGFENPMTSPDDLIVGLQSDEDNFATVPNGATVSSYGEWAGNLDDYAIDENDGTAWQASDNDVIGSWIIVDLGAARNIYQVHILQSFSTSNQNAASHHWTLEYSEDGAGWTQIVDRNYGGHPASMDDVVDFTPTFARYWRMTNVAEIPENWGWALRTLDLIGTTSAGDPGTPVRLAVGTAGQVLKVNPDDGHIAWLDNDIDGLSDVDTSSVAPTDGQSLVWNASTSKWEPATVSSGASLTVEESDSSPSVGTVDKLIFPADSVTDNSDGSVSISFPSASGGVTVSELDGDPSVSDAGEIKFDGATVTDNADGTVTVSITGDGTGDPFPSWQDWTPNFVVGGTSVPLSASTRARYLHIGTTVFVSADIIPASGSYSGVFEIRNFPKPFAGTFGDRFSGVMARFVNQGSGFYDLVIERSNATTIIFNSVNAYQNYNSTINASDGDLLTFQMMYETTEDSGWTGGAASVIDDLSDVDTSSVAPTDGQSLVWNDSSSTWEPGTVSGVDTSAIHDNVSGEISVITEKATPVAGDFLLIEDSEDGNSKKRIQIGNLPGGSSVTNIDDLGDVDTSSSAPTDGQSLVWDNAGSKWIPGNAGSSVLSNAVLVASNMDSTNRTYTAKATWEDIANTDTNFTPPVDGDYLFLFTITFDYQTTNWQTHQIRLMMDEGSGYSQVGFTQTIDQKSVNADITEVFTVTVQWVKTLTGGVPVDAKIQTYDGNSDVDRRIRLTTLNVIGSGQISAVDDLSDVDTTSSAPTAGQALIWDDVSSKWIPGSPSGTLSNVGASVVKSSPQTVPNATQTIMNWDTELWDTDNFHDNTTNNSRFTIPYDGEYVVSVTLGYPSSLNGDYRTADIYVNGVLNKQSIEHTSKAYWITVGGTYVLDLNAGDYVEVKGQQNSGGSLDVTNYSHITNFSISMLGSSNAPIGSINNLTDVDTSSVAPTDGQSLVWNDSGSTWEPGTVSGVDTSAIHDNVSGEISALTEKATPVSGDLILIEDSEDSNSKKYVQVGSLPTGAVSADELSDVDTSSVAPTDGQALVWSDSESKWIPGDVSSSGGDATSIRGITIAESAATPADGDILAYANSGLLFGADTLDGTPVDDGTSSSNYTVHGSDYVFTFSGRLAIKEMNPYLYNNNTLTLGIYPDGGGGLLYSETFSVTAGQNNLVLSEPFEVTSGTRYYFRFNFSSGMKRVKASSNTGTYFTAYTDHESNPLHKTQFTFAEILGNDEAWHTVSNDIDRLSDVDTSSVVPTDGQSLVWNDANSAWEPGTPAATDTSAIHDNVSGEISLITEKATPVNADLLVIEDSADSNSKKRIQIGSLPFATAIDDLSDVDTSSVAPTDGQSLIWNATDSEWQSGNAILPGATVYISSAISIPNSTPTILNFDTESYDDLDFHDSSINTSRLTISDNGRYHITLSGIFASNANGYRQIALLRNGAYEWTSVESAVNGTATSVDFEYILELVAGDYLELRVTQNSGGLLDLTGARFGIERVR